MMDVMYQLTFFLALTILAILITIFVFAVSLLGRATEAAAKAEKERLAERKENNAREMAAIKEDIEKGEASGQIPTKLIQKLKELGKEDKKFEKKIDSIKKAPELLTVKGGVVPAAASLLGALILSGAAWHLSNIQILIWRVPVFIWILALAAIGYSISRIYRCLGVIEGVAITSEEAALMREIKAFERALKEIEQEKKPELKLKFRGKQPPFHMRADTEMSLELQLSLNKGDVAEYPAVHLLAPPGFNFPDRKTYVLSPSHDYANYIGTIWQPETVIRGLVCDHTITIKAPSKAGSFRIAYYTFCKGYQGKPTEIEVIVE